MHLRLAYIYFTCLMFYPTECVIMSLLLKQHECHLHKHMLFYINQVKSLRNINLNKMEISW